jgi:phosphoribosyl 1,2-cyclic phosphodiesterase
LAKASLTRIFAEGSPLSPFPGLVIRPIRVSHDAEPTFAFRFDRTVDEDVVWSVGYASDLGCGSPELVEAFAGVDVLALEYNHDLRMEERSRRPRFLIDRVLSDRGHLSNCQAAALTRAIASRSGEGFPGHLVQLHLSRECNRPALAGEAGRASLAGLRPRAVVVTAQQHMAAQPIRLHRQPNAANRFASGGGEPALKLAPRGGQPSLPGFDD